MQKSQTVMAPNLAPFAAILADKPKVSSAAWLQRLGDHGYAHFTQFGLPQQGFEGGNSPHHGHLRSAFFIRQAS